MCARCQELEEEVAYLKSELGLQQQVDEYDRLRATFGITRSQYRILMALRASAGRPVNRFQLEDHLETDAENTGGNLVNVFISKLRKAIGRDAIATVWGEGYRLTDVGRARLAEALKPQSKDIAA